MLSRIVNSNNVSVAPWKQGPSADGSSCSDGPVAVVLFLFVDRCVIDDVACVIDVVRPFWSLLLVCLLLSLFHGQIIRASTRICDPSHFKRLHL